MTEPRPCTKLRCFIDVNESSRGSALPYPTRHSAPTRIARVRASQPTGMAMRINIPPLTRAILAASVFFSLFTMGLRFQASRNVEGAVDPINAANLASQWMTLVPALSIIFPWTIVLCSFIETDLLSLVLTLATLFYGGKYLERAWGSWEFAKFLLVITIGPNLVTLFACLALFVVTRDTTYVQRNICGGTALQAGFLVAFKQLVPEHTVTLFRGILKIRVKNFPGIFLTVNQIISIITGSELPTTLATAGFFLAWVYLRFFKTTLPEIGGTTGAALKGDASETFALAHFFPEFIQPPIAYLSNLVFSLLVTIRVCTPFSEHDVEAGNARAEARGDLGLNGLTRLAGNGVGGGGSTLPGSARAEAERRRALALKALDQRLQTNNKTSTAPGPITQMSSSMDQQSHE